MKRAWSQLGEFWCRHMHPAPMWPVKGRYQCPACLRAYPVAWEQKSGHTPAPVRVVAANRTFRDARGAELVATVLSK